MSKWQLKLEDPTVDAAISKSGNQIVILSGKDVCLYSVDFTKQPIAPPKLLWRSEPFVNQSPRQISFVEDKIFVLTDSWDDPECGLWEVDENSLIYHGPIGAEAPLSGLVTDLAYQDLYLLYQNGALHKLEPETGLNDGSNAGVLVNKFPTSTPDVRVIRDDGKVCDPYPSISTI